MTGTPPRAAAGGGGRDLLAGLLAVVAAHRPDADAGLIGRAYRVAARVHAGQARKSGAPYITHPVAVAAILAEAAADDQILCAALLHDTLDGTGYGLAALRAEFGAAVADLVTGAARLDDSIDSRKRRHPAGSSEANPNPDPRVLMIKLADRLHNLQTIAPLPPARQLSASRDTLDVLLPLAESPRFDAITTELKDLAARTVSRHAAGSASASAHLLAAGSALLPAATRARWRDEWAGELSALPARHQRAVFAARTLAGIPRLAATLRRPWRGGREPRSGRNPA